jgi:hypothetical protein
MGKHASLAQKAEFLTYLKCGKNVLNVCKLTGIPKSTGYDIRNACKDLEVEHVEKGLLEPTIDEKVARKLGSRKSKVLTDNDCQQIFNACTKDKASRKKCKYYVALKKGLKLVDVQLRLECGR